MHGDVAFFVLDTRRCDQNPTNLSNKYVLMVLTHRYRSVVGADISEGDSRTILGDKQMADFTKWVGKVCAHSSPKMDGNSSTAPLG